MASQAFTPFRLILKCVAIAIILFWSMNVQAQTVSLYVGQTTNYSDSLAMEIAMKKYLRAEGYEVKGQTVKEGYFVIVQVMPIKGSIAQSVSGYTGSVFIGSIAWPKYIDSLLPVSCDIGSYQGMKDYLGIDMVMLDSTLGIDSSIDSLAELLATFANRIIREKTIEVEALFQEIEKRTQENRDIQNYPTR